MSFSSFNFSQRSQQAARRGAGGGASGRRRRAEADRRLADLAGDGSWGTMPAASEELQAAWNIVAEAAGLTGTAVFSGQSYDAMALIILASQAAGSTDRAAIAAEVLNVANAQGIECAAGDLGTCLKYISGGLPVDYVGATGVELDALGTPNGSYSEQEIVAGAFTSLRVH